MKFRAVNKDPISRKGFTLIELLVVISIIGMLASVVLVSLQSARQTAYDSVVARDLYAIRNAITLWSMENRNTNDPMGKNLPLPVPVDGSLKCLADMSITLPVSGSQYDPFTSSASYVPAWQCLGKTLSQYMSSIPYPKYDYTNYGITTQNSGANECAMYGGASGTCPNKPCTNGSSVRNHTILTAYVPRVIKGSYPNECGATVPGYMSIILDNN